MVKSLANLPHYLYSINSKGSCQESSLHPSQKISSSSDWLYTFLPTPTSHASQLAASGSSPPPNCLAVPSLRTSSTQFHTPPHGGHLSPHHALRLLPWPLKPNSSSSLRTTPRSFYFPTESTLVYLNSPHYLLSPFEFVLPIHRRVGPSLSRLPPISRERGFGEISYSSTPQRSIRKPHPPCRDATRG